MTKIRFFILFSGILSISLCSATPLRRVHVPSGARWLFHADIDTLFSSEIGKLMQQSMRDEHKDQIEALKLLLGIDLTQDIDGITVYGVQAGEENACTLFYGTFQKEKLLALLRLNKAYSESNYNGQTLYYWKDDKSQKNQVGAFASDDLIVIGQKESCVILALDSISGAVESLAQHQDTPLFSLCNVPVSTFLLAAAEGVSDLVSDNHQAAILKNSKTLSIVSYEDAGRLNFDINLETENETAAVQVEQVVRGMMAFASLNEKTHPQFTPLLQAATLSREANKLICRFNYPSNELFDILKSLGPANLTAEINGTDAATVQ